jgi:hypothetical protein
MNLVGIVLFLLVWVPIAGFFTLAPRLIPAVSSVFADAAAMAWVALPFTVAFAAFSPSRVAGAVVLINFLLWLGFVVVLWQTGSGSPGG